MLTWGPFLPLPRSFTTTSSKSRLNFLEVLTAGDTTHLINEAAIAYMREHNLSGIVINKLAAHTSCRRAGARRRAGGAARQARRVAGADLDLRTIAVEHGSTG
jgi:hypothetical protein